MSAPLWHPSQKPAPKPPERPDFDAEALARLFHETYERLAPEYGYETRCDSAVPWEDVPEKNKRLMVVVAAVVTRSMESEIERRLASPRRIGGDKVSDHVGFIYAAVPARDVIHDPHCCTTRDCHKVCSHLCGDADLAAKCCYPEGWCSCGSPNTDWHDCGWRALRGEKGAESE